MESVGSQKYIVKTLGCKANFFDSMAIESRLEQAGWSQARDSDPEVRLCVVNSCTVTDEADKQSRKEAARLKKRYPQARVVFTGCGAEVAAEKLLGSAGIDYVYGNQDKDRLVTQVLERMQEQGLEREPPRVLGHVSSYSEMRSQHPIEREWALPERLDALPEHARTRHFLKIQEGCDAFCTYCVIPYGRGPARSLRPREVIQDVRKAIALGVREVILTGTNLGEYGMDGSSASQPPARGQLLAELVDQLLEHTSIERLRVSSLDPSEITPHLLDLMRGSDRLCPHFHVSLQHVDDGTLRRMKRRYRTDDVKESLRTISELRGPSGLRPFVGMDFIVGFPGEGHDDFQKALQSLEALPWDRLHVFPYSERAGTPATRLDGRVEPAVRKERARALAELGFRRLQARYQEGVSRSRLRGVLIEGAVRGPDGTRRWMAGYTPDYLRVVIPYDSRLINQVLDLKAESLWLDRAGQDVSILSRFDTTG